MTTSKVMVVWMLRHRDGYLVPCYCGPQRGTCLAMYRLNSTTNENPDPTIYKPVKVEIREIAPARRKSLAVRRGRKGT